MATTPPINTFKDLNDIDKSFLSSTGLVNLGFNTNLNQVVLLDYLHNDKGFVFVQDSAHTALNPLSISGGVTTTLPIDSLGPLTNYTNVPLYARSWWNPLVNKFYPSISGEYFIARVNFTVIQNLNNKSIVVTTNIGTSTKITSDSIFINSGAGLPIRITSLICFGTSNTYVNNGMKIEITSECDCSIYGINLLLHRC